MKNCIYNDEDIIRKNYSIRAKDFQLYTQENNKIGARSIDNKRYMLNSISNIPYTNSKEIKKNSNKQIC